MVNHFEYAKKSKARSTDKLKWATQNGRKQENLIKSREHIAGDMWQYTKYMKALKDRKNQIHHKKSIAVLRECEQDGIEPNIVIYSLVLHNCSKSMAPTMVGVKLLQEMIIKYKIQPNYVIFSSILKLFHNNGAYIDCILLFALTRNNFDINFKEWFKDYKNSREISYILDNQTLLQKLKQIEVNDICANIVLKSIGKLGDIEKVSHFFQSMIKANMMPNDVTMNQFLNIFASNKKIDKMEKLFKWWLNNTQLLQFEPDIITINSMLNGYAKVGEFDKSEQLFNKYCSKEHGADKSDSFLMPTVITFSHIISCVAKCIDDISDRNDEQMRLQWRDQALKYFKKMQIIYGMDDYYNSATTAVMNVCLKCNDLHTLLKVFDERRLKDNRDRQMYNIVFRGLFREGLIGEALNLFQEGVELNVLKYLNSTGPYSMDLHGYDTSTAIIAIMHNLKTICETIKKRKDFKVPTIWIVVGKGLNSENEAELLRNAIPKYLSEERLFDPPLESYIPHWNQGLMKINDESLLKYLAHQLKIDPTELRPKFLAFQTDKTDKTMLDET